MTLILITLLLLLLLLCWLIGFRARQCLCSESLFLFCFFLLCFVLVVPLPDVFHLFPCSVVLISVCSRSTLIDQVVLVSSHFSFSSLLHLDSS